MKNTAKKTAQKEAATQNAKNAKTTKGRKEEDMKKTVIEHTDGSRETITAEDMKKKNAARYNAEKVATLRKWAKARGIADADSMKKTALVAALVADDATPKEEKEAAKTARKEAAQKKDAEAKKTAAAKKDAPKKEKKTAAPKPKKDSAQKKEDAPKMDSVKTSWEKEDARIVCAMDVANMQNAEIADALNTQKTLKLYEAKGADSMKDFVENKCRTAEDIAAQRKGKYHGMSYNTVNLYINAHNYIYSMKDEDGFAIFMTYGMHLIQALVVPCRYHAEAVREAVKDGRVNASMSLEALKKLIEAEAWKSPKKEAAEAKKPTAATEAAEEAEEAATASTLPKTEKHNGITDEAAEAAAAILSAFIDEAEADSAKKEAATKALETLMKRADI